MDMNEQIVQGLLERLLADAKLAEPRYTSVVSALERNAIAALLSKTHVKPLAEEIPLAPAVLTQSEIAPAVELSPVPLNLELASIRERADQDYVVCVDFGTAKSKAFAARLSEHGEEPLGFELGLGRLDRDMDGSQYSVASSVWISDDGLMFAGSEALRRSAEANDRMRLDSIKQQLSQSNHQQSLTRYLDESINPTKVKFSHGDALCFFLAYLTDLVGLELEHEHGLSRYTRRRFTIPAWSDAQRQWANDELKTVMKRAQILADTFRGKWASGIPISQVKEAINLASIHDASLNHLLDETWNKMQYGISEPMAAGAGRIRLDKSTRNLVLVVDVGAGTTDFGLFIVNFEMRTAIPVEPKSVAIKRAGNHVDDLLVELILSKVEGYPDKLTKERINNDLRRTGLRQKKERLFTQGTQQFPLVSGQIVSIARSEFLASEGVVSFSMSIEAELRAFLAKVHGSFEAAAEKPIMLLTGGGASLPFVAALPQQKWKIGNREVSFTAGKAVPDALLEYDNAFQQEYAQLAVAMGGAIQVVDEKKALLEWGGGVGKPAALSRYAVTGN